MLDANPLIGYFDIYRNYYANPHDRRVPYRVQNSNNLVPLVSEYRYFNLDDLDQFITTISNNSVTNQPGYGVSPSSVDVWQTLRATVHDDRYSIAIGNSQLTTEQRDLVGIPLFANQRLFSGTLSGNEAQFDTTNGLNFGLLPRTYKDDYFNSRFMNEFVTYMEQTSAVEVENNMFYITQLRLQNRIAKYIDKSIFSDTRFGSWIKAHFGTKTNAKLNIPQFLGSISSNVVFNDIYATAQTSQNGTITSNEALGSRASLGQGYVKNGKGSFIEFKASEPGYIMIMFSLVPNVNYFRVSVRCTLRVRLTTCISLSLMLLAIKIYRSLNLTVLFDLCHRLFHILKVLIRLGLLLLLTIIFLLVSSHLGLSI